MRVYVYILTSPEGKSYIGISKDPERRIGNHLKAKSLIGNALRKHGPENFTFDILDTVEEWKEAQETEKYFIDLYNTFPPPNGYNLTEGGDGGDTISNHPLGANKGEKNGSKRPEVRKIISEKAIGRKRSPESIRKQSESAKGKKKGPMKEKTKELLRQANLGKKQSKETIEKRLKTRKENGTFTGGEKNGSSKLTEDLVRVIFSCLPRWVL